MKWSQQTQVPLDHAAWSGLRKDTMQMRAQSLGVSASTLLLTVLPSLSHSFSRHLLSAYCCQPWPALGIYVHNLIYPHHNPRRQVSWMFPFYKWGPCSERWSNSAKLQLPNFRSEIWMQEAETPKSLSCPLCQAASQVLRRYLIEAQANEWPKGLQFW